MCLVHHCAHVHTCVASAQTSCTLPAARGLPRAPVRPAPPPQSGHRCSRDRHLNLALPVLALHTNSGPDFTATWQPEDIVGMRWGSGAHAQQPRDLRLVSVRSPGAAGRCRFGWARSLGFGGSSCRHEWYTQQPRPHDRYRHRVCTRVPGQPVVLDGHQLTG